MWECVNNLFHFGLKKILFVIQKRSCLLNYSHLLSRYTISKHVIEPKAPSTNLKYSFAGDLVRLQGMAFVSLLKHLELQYSVFQGWSQPLQGRTQLKLLAT